MGGMIWFISAICMKNKYTNRCESSLLPSSTIKIPNFSSLDFNNSTVCRQRHIQFTNQSGKYAMTDIKHKILKQ